MGFFKKIAFLLFFSVLISSCKEEKKDPSAEQMKEVLAVHDEVMPKMGTISKLVAQLKPKVDSTEQGKTYEKAMKGLQESNTEMMEWMQRFGERFDSDEIMNGKALTPEKKRWLKEEKQKIEALKQNVEVTISEAEALLQVQ
ncbi:hypothetical protein N9954_01370 [Maribacter sp.]|nr:hypothetical protein [Maribacter sp.]